MKLWRLTFRRAPEDRERKARYHIYIVVAKTQDEAVVILQKNQATFYGEELFKAVVIEEGWTSLSSYRGD